MNHNKGLHTEDLSYIVVTEESRRKCARELTPLHDKAFEHIFIEDKNNDLLTDIVNSLRGIHDLEKIPPIEASQVQSVSPYEFGLSGSVINNRKMIADLVGTARGVNITVEAQKTRQEAFSTRAVLSSANAMRLGLAEGQDFSDVRDTIGINILGFALPELRNTDAFISRIVRANYDTKEFFLAEKFSDYFLELPKLPKDREQVLEPYRELWDLCHLLTVKIMDMEEVMKMMNITSPMAVRLAEESKKLLDDSLFLDAATRHEMAKELFELKLEEREQRGEQRGLEEGFKSTARAAVVGRLGWEFVLGEAERSGFSVDKAREFYDQEVSLLPVLARGSVLRKDKEAEEARLRAQATAEKARSGPSR